MKISAKLNYLRISPRKVRMVVDLIKGLDVEQAEAQLKFNTKRASKPLLKLLNSAVANAFHNFDIEKDNLYISEMQVNEGPPFKRWIPRAMGRATPITKKTSHIILILLPKKKVKLNKKKPAKPEIVKPEELKQEAIEEEKPEKKSKKKAPKKQKLKKSRIKGLGKKFFRRKSF